MNAPAPVVGAGADCVELACGAVVGERLGDEGVAAAPAAGATGCCGSGIPEDVSAGCRAGGAD